jgi:hypothetical protein
MSYTSLLFHCVFATKERRFLISDGLQARLWHTWAASPEQTASKLLKLAECQTTLIF